MITDQNKAITSIKYNHLNLPSEIVFKGTNRKINYLYNANGTKKQKSVTNGALITTTDYLDGFQYSKTGSAVVLLDFFPTAEGYVKNTVVSGVNNYNYIYNYTDHLGNIRLSYTYETATSSLKIVEENNYYPFGLKQNGFNMTKETYDWINGSNGLKIRPAVRLSYQYKYNGKELQDELGLNMYDYGARNYDPALGRWMNIDPLAEKYPNISPYVYVANNPINAIDPDGREIIFIVRGETRKQDQQLTYRKGNFYHENGKRYNPAKESLSPTMYTVLSAYRKIESSNDKVLKSQLHKLETSDEKHYVEKSPNRDNSVNDLRSDKAALGIPTGTQTQFDFDVTGKTPFETVVHEMRHQFDYDIGNMIDAHPDSTAKDPAEIRAVHNENRANDILGKKHRTTYGGEKIDPKELENPPNNKQVENVQR
jgi:RHS repeat-associated protein